MANELGWCPFAERIYGVYRYTGGGGAKVGFCDHTAAGYLNTMRDPSFWNDSVKCSVHFAIGRDGRIAQIINIFDRAWAQGILYNPTAAIYFSEGSRNPNEYLISTEHEDYENGRMVSHWTDAEYDADIRVKRWCVDEVKRVHGVDLLKYGRESLTGHHMFNSRDRAACPGKDWRETYRNQIYTDLTVAQGPDLPEGGYEDVFVVNKHWTGDPDAYKAYLARGNVWTHIPDAATWQSLQAAGLPNYWPDKIGWDFMTKGVKLEG